MLVASVLLMPLRVVTTSSGSGVASSTTGVLAVCGASAGIGCGLAGADVVRATIGVSTVGVGSTAGAAGWAAGCAAAAPAGSTIGMLVVGVGSLTGSLLTGW